MLISNMIRAECNSRGTPRCKVVYTHARTTFQGARNIEMHDRVSVYVFRCTKKSVPMLAIAIEFLFYFCHQKKSKHPWYISLWDAFLWNLKQDVWCCEGHKQTCKTPLTPPILALSGMKLLRNKELIKRERFRCFVQDAGL